MRKTVIRRKERRDGPMEFEPNNSQNGDKVFVAAVGAPFNRDETGTSSQQGSVSIFQPTGDPATWGRTEEFFGEHGDLMGTALAMAADTVVAGSEGLDGRDSMAVVRSRS